MIFLKFSTFLKLLPPIDHKNFSLYILDISILKQFWQDNYIFDEMGRKKFQTFPKFFNNHNFSTKKREQALLS